MPDVKLYIDEEALPFFGSEAGRELEKELARRVRLITAEQMRCEEYPHIVSGNVDLHIIRFGSGTDYRLHTSALALVEVSGYNFPTRMENIDERLGAIGRIVKDFIEEQLPDLRDPAVSLTFVPNDEKCWVEV